MRLTVRKTLRSARVRMMGMGRLFLPRAGGPSEEAYKPSVIITISNRYGCGAIAVAQSAAQQLGFEFVDEQLPVVVAKRLKTSPQAVETAEHRARSVSERMLRALEFATPELGGLADQPTFAEECLREVKEAVRDYASHGNVVLIGRGANAILGRRPDVLRVFMYAPRDWRVRHIMEGHAVDERTAAAEVERVDRARGQYMQAYYGVKWIDHANYDLAIDTATFGQEDSARLIVNAARSR